METAAKRTFCRNEKYFQILALVYSDLLQSGTVA